MYPASDAFHEAVRDGKEQKAMLIFKDCVFTDMDINVENGIEFHDYFNTEKDISIGQTPSNEVIFSLFNDDRLLNDYEFGEFTATIGVLVGEDGYQHYGNVTVNSQRAMYIGNANYPYVTRNGAVLPVQPAFAIRSIAVWEGKVWCFGDNGRYAVYDDSTGENVTSQNRLNAFMKEKSKQFEGEGIFYNRNSRILFLYRDGTRRRFEFVPLGVFIAKRPNAPDQIQIDMRCLDRMQKFDDDMPSDEKLGITYPISIAGLYHKLCDYVGVPYRNETLINGSAMIASRPDDFENATMRTVLKWIAEAAASNARFDRDGFLHMDWVRETGQIYQATGYREFNPYWYETKRIDKLYNRDVHGGSETAVGDGDNAYLIQDNPLLKGVT